MHIGFDVDDLLLTAPTKSSDTIQGMCFRCYREEGPEKEHQLIACAGRCCRQFHVGCVGLKQIPNKWKCRACVTKQRECFLCHRRGQEGDAVGKGKKRSFAFYEQWLRVNDIEQFITLFGSGGVIDADRSLYQIDEPLIKCAQHNCGCFYHMSCVQKASERFVRYEEQHPCMFRCPRHYCRVCGKNALNQVLLVCVKCPNAFHASCLSTIPHQTLVRKFIICNEHDAETKPSKRRSATETAGKDDKRAEKEGGRVESARKKMRVTRRKNAPIAENGDGEDVEL